MIAENVPKVAAVMTYDVTQAPAPNLARRASWFNDLLALERWTDFMTGPGGSGNPPMAPKPCIFPVNKVETDLVE